MPLETIPCASCQTPVAIHSRSTGSPVGGQSDDGTPEMFRFAESKEAWIGMLSAGPDVPGELIVACSDACVVMIMMTPRAASTNFSAEPCDDTDCNDLGHDHQKPATEPPTTEPSPT